MTKRTTDTPPVVSPLLDTYGNPTTPVAPGALIESAWGNSVASRVVYHFPTRPQLDAWSAPVGTVAVTTDTHTVFLRDGTSTWRPIAGNLIAARAVGGAPGQSAPASTNITCTWAAEQSDPFGVLSGGVFTVLPGWGGRYMFEWAVNVDPGDVGVRVAWLQVGPRRYSQDRRSLATGGGETTHNGAASVVMAPGDTAYIVVLLTTGSGNLMNTSADQYFQGRYVGPY